MIYVVLNKSGSCIYGALRTEKGAREQIVSSSTSNYQPHDNNKSHMPMVDKGKCGGLIYKYLVEHLWSEN